jgi:hypothetical protein
MASLPSTKDTNWQTVFKKRLHMGGIRKGKKIKNLNTIDVLTV